MSERIEPAMNAHQWRQFRADAKDQLLPRYFAHCDHPSFIAKHNDALPDSAPQKITRERIAALRHAFSCLENDHGWDCGDLYEFADALASYLPPEGT